MKAAAGRGAARYRAARLKSASRAKNVSFFFSFFLFIARPCYVSSLSFALHSLFATCENDVVECALRNSVRSLRSSSRRNLGERSSFETKRGRQRSRVRRLAGLAASRYAATITTSLARGLTIKLAIKYYRLLREAQRRYVDGSR